jgi:hypothetical protein
MWHTTAVSRRFGTSYPLIQGPAHRAVCSATYS